MAEVNPKTREHLLATVEVAIILIRQGDNLIVDATQGMPIVADDGQVLTTLEELHALTDIGSEIGGVLANLVRFRKELREHL